eukprot:8408974-Heterocapsa_arctica.AAC.1
MLRWAPRLARTSFSPLRPAEPTAYLARRPIASTSCPTSKWQPVRLATAASQAAGTVSTCLLFKAPGAPAA